MSSADASLRGAAVVRPVLRRRLGVFGAVLGAQALVQALGFAASLLWVHALDPSAYALLTLLLSAAAVAAVLADAGMTNGVLAVAAARPRAALLATVVRLQRPLLWALVLIGVPAIASVLWPHRQAFAWGDRQAAFGVGVGAVLAVLLAALQAHNSARQSFVRAAGDIGWLQRRDLLLAAVRLAGGAALALAWLAWTEHLTAGSTLAGASGTGAEAGAGAGSGSGAGALLALGVHVMAAVLFARMVRQWMRDRPVPAEDASASAEAATALRGQMRRQAPNAAWYVVASQVSLWLVAVLGSTGAVAEVGALGRLAGLFALVAALVAFLAEPAFARAHRPETLRRGFLALNLGFAVLLALLLALAAAWPAALLALLGPKYAHLQTELLWMVLAATLASWNGAIYSIGCARGWVLPLPWAVAANIGATALAVGLFDVSTTAGAFALNACNALVSLIVAAVYVHRHLRATAMLPAGSQAAA